MRRVALFGGSFDPVHRGHRFIAERALSQCDLDEVVFLPCRESPHKKGVAMAGGEDRLAMVRLAIGDLKGATASDWELLREGASYSWQTAEHWRVNVLSARDSLFWILGMDQWAALSRWSRIDYLAGLVTFIVFPRNGAVPKSFPGRESVFLPDAMEVSATEIRTKCASGLAIVDDVGPEVAGYVGAKRLYQIV